MSTLHIARCVNHVYYMSGDSICQRRAACINETFFPLRLHRVHHDLQCDRDLDVVHDEALTCAVCDNVDDVQSFTITRGIMRLVTSRPVDKSRLKWPCYIQLLYN
jgi:hypothetical protein